MRALDYQESSKEFCKLLGLQVPPIAITFSSEVPNNLPRFDEPMPEPLEDGRTGRVPAGCVFWFKATEKTFYTVPEDHLNCSVGSLTHGLISLDEAAQMKDIEAICNADWVNPEVFPQIPTVKNRANFIIYGPLCETLIKPDVIFLRLNGNQLMMIHDAYPDLKFEGKPQCHIIPIAKEKERVAVSLGCMLSRVRTGMSNNEVTCAIPAEKWHEIVTKLKASKNADILVAAYAAEDSKRFSMN